MKNAGSEVSARIYPLMVDYKGKLWFRFQTSEEYKIICVYDPYDEQLILLDTEINPDHRIFNLFVKGKYMYLVTEMGGLARLHSIDGTLEKSYYKEVYNIQSEGGGD